ncbi:PepSY domain-containing protein [Psychrobacillus antarcticus]|uniref:PepSY domain-containing protein n=1 Tax=Psychrobacillus antarcticus TaxID=2879115 RepID=UPI002407DA76|nr:PepSY domain-containing protein [Psychrobacillus antarcticus]
MVNPMYGQRITLEQATNIVLQRVSGEVVHVDLDMEDGLVVYEVFIMTPSNQVFEVDVHARTRNVMKIDQEEDFDFD